MIKPAFKYKGVVHLSDMPFHHVPSTDTELVKAYEYHARVIEGFYETRNGRFYTRNQAKRIYGK